jgi:hypothetical protein
MWGPREDQLECISFLGEEEASRGPPGMCSPIPSLELRRYQVGKGRALVR